MDNVRTGLLIAQIRKEKGYTQKDLAEKIGVSNATVSKWETGKGFPDISLLEPLAISLNISITEILAGEIIKTTDLTEHIISDLVDVTIKDQEKKVKLFNWIVAITVALIYIIASLITMKWEITWIIWVVYCVYRISTEFVFKKR
ncbi:MAG: helix-turn-helix transcriptional regulator [Lachnospiraceae bacterium]|nr:helix-turn-helix transcriptional regulator [Lachnospiraceae bacterium]